MQISFEQLPGDVELLRATFCEDGEVQTEPANWEAGKTLEKLMVRCQSLPTEVISQFTPDAVTEGKLHNEAIEYTYTITNPQHDLPKDAQQHIQSACEDYLGSIKGTPEGDTPIYSLAIWLSTFLADNAEIFKQDDETLQPEPEVSNPGKICIKRVLIWSHHLLAVSKRKDIVNWSSELGLAGLSKPGYPGIIVIEGLLEDADEFVARIKRLQWQALQIRCEETEDFEVPANESDVVKFARTKTRLKRPQDAKPIVHEVEALSDVASLLKTANLEEMFSSAMKLGK